MSGRFFTYAVLRCADEQRDEALNVGIVVVHEESGGVLARTTDDLRRIERTLPNVPVRHARVLLNGAAERLEAILSEEGIRALNRVHHEWNGTVRLSNPRSIWGEQIERVLDDLFGRYVVLTQLPEGAQVEERTGPAPKNISSLQVIRSLKSRLHKRGLRVDRDFSENMRIVGLTRNEVRVPVWFPLVVRNTHFLDGIRVNATNEQFAFDSARVMGQKAGETFRAHPNGQGVVVSITVRERTPTDLGDRVRELIEGEGSLNGYRPRVHLVRETADYEKVVSALGPFPEQEHLPGFGRGEEN